MSDLESSVSALSSASDSEFWTGLDLKPTINDLVSGIDDSTRPFSAFDDSHSFELSLELVKRQSKALSPDTKGRSRAAEEQYLRRFEQSLEMLRKAKRVEVANSSVVVKQSMVREFEGKLGSLQQAFQAQKHAYKRDKDFIKSELMSKSSEVKRLQGIIEEQEMLITQLRLSQHPSAISNLAESTALTPVQYSQSQSSADINIEAELAQAQVESLNQVVEQYKKEAENKEILAKETVDRMTKMTRNFDMERIRFGLEMSRLKEESAKERDEAQKQLRQIRQQAAMESKLNEEIQKRLQDAIAKMQEELRTAKLVLSHPKLRTKVFTRMKDVENAMEEIRQGETDIARSPSAASRTSRASRRFGHSIHVNQVPGLKVWNPKDHVAYMHSTEQELPPRSIPSNRATSAQRSEVRRAAL